MDYKSQWRDEIENDFIFTYFTYLKYFLPYVNIKCMPIFVLNVLERLILLAGNS